MKTIAEATEKLCWTAIRAFLKTSSEAVLREFAAQHAEEEFYCLCVYFDGNYGDFWLYLNDHEQLRTTAAEVKNSYPSLYKRKSVKQVERELKWDCGDFRYDLSEAEGPFPGFWRPVALTIIGLNLDLAKDAGDEPTREFQEAWAETACRVALDLEKSKVLKRLKKTRDFRVICVDHDEPIKVSLTRLERVRRSYKPLPK